MTISDEAVEAAAKAAWLAGLESQYHNTWEFLEEGGALKRVYRAIARAALEAAAQHLTGAAWEEGYGHGYKHGYSDCMQLNGYQRGGPDQGAGNE